MSQILCNEVLYHSNSKSNSYRTFIIIFPFQNVDRGRVKDCESYFTNKKLFSFSKFQWTIIYNI